MSALARLLLNMGKTVYGSDLVKTKICQDLIQKGIIFFSEQKGENIPWDTDLFIYSEALPEHHPERKRARVSGIPSLNYPKALGWFLSRYRHRIVVSGTNGKTTTTAIIGKIFEDGGKDPTVIVGSLVKQFQGTNSRYGQSSFAIAEGCEWRAHMLYLMPTTIVLTNIEEDHLDYYRDIHHIQQTFEQYVNYLPSHGMLIMNGDDPISRELHLPKAPCIWYGREKTGDVVISDIHYIEPGKQVFFLTWKKQRIGPCEISFPGIHNVYNAAAAATCGLAHGISEQRILKTLREFQGTWRRFEMVGTVKGALLISDYAHLPTAIRLTLAGAKGFFPHRRIIAVFQPHHHDRTQKLFMRFVESFGDADEIILTNIYHVAGRDDEYCQNIHTRDLVRAMKQFSHHVHYCPSLDDVENFLLSAIRPNDVVLIMGAGDIYRVAERLCSMKN